MVLALPGVRAVVPDIVGRLEHWETMYYVLAQGVPARAIMDVLGHAEIGVTMNTYAHVLPVPARRRPTPSTSCSGT
jgi:hypothetical protein